MTKQQLPKLSPTETEILRFVWDLNKATVQEVCENLPTRRRMSYATVQTLLRRLEKKGYLPTLADQIVRDICQDFHGRTSRMSNLFSAILLQPSL